MFFIKTFVPWGSHFLSPGVSSVSTVNEGGDTSAHLFQNLVYSLCWQPDPATTCPNVERQPFPWLPPCPMNPYCHWNRNQVGVGPRAGLSHSLHTRKFQLLLQGPGSRQFTNTRSDTISTPGDKKSEPSDTKCLIKKDYKEKTVLFIICQYIYW